MSDPYSHLLWKQFCKRPLGLMALALFIFIALIGLYAPLLASSRPLAILYDGTWYFPLFRYLFHIGFFTKRLDIFYNILMFTFPLLLLFRKRVILRLLVVLVHFAAFIFFAFLYNNDPASDPKMNIQYQKLIQEKSKTGSWQSSLLYMPPYAKLNMVLSYHLMKEQDKRLQKYAKSDGNHLPTPYLRHQKNLSQGASNTLEKEQWLEKENIKISWIAMPLLRHFHWEDDAGGEQQLNKCVSWWEVTRSSHKDLVAALIFGIRISLMVGVTAVALQILIGIPVGALAGYFGGKIDIIINRLAEIWEGMPTFFMLLLVVAITQSKSIFLIIIVLGLFGWTGICRFIRGEVLKQRHLPYVDACHSLGYTHPHIIFSHILPNAMPPILTLLPFALLGAITSEAGLSFLGLGEEGSCSWGILMEEGRQAFPGESYLLWPPAIMLTVMLISIALVGDAIRDAFDPKMRK